jgi:hypothetical protein
MTTEDTENTEGATPETDAFITSQDYSPTGHQWRNFTRKLERERDEARRQAADAITNYTLMEAKCFRLEHHDQFKS